MGLFDGLFGGGGPVGGLFSGLGEMFKGGFEGLGGLFGNGEGVFRAPEGPVGSGNIPLSNFIQPQTNEMPMQGQGMLMQQGDSPARMSSYTGSNAFAPLSAAPPEIQAKSGFGTTAVQPSMNPNNGGLLGQINNQSVNQPLGQAALPGTPKLSGQSASNTINGSSPVTGMDTGYQGSIGQLNTEGSIGSIGQLAAKYETSGKGPGYISTGMGGKDPGGISYGSYQLESNKGTLQGYLKSGDQYANQLSNYKINSPEFKQKWAELAKSDPKGFEESQFNYLANKPGGFNDALSYAKGLGWDTDNPAMRAAIFSTSNQSGGWKSGIFSKAGINPNDDPATQINKLYDARANYFSRLNLNPEVKRNIIKNRTIDERNDALRMIGV